jgi:oligopeptide/dipeptide ABC transporter ATP-binding protein
MHSKSPTYRAASKTASSGTSPDNGLVVENLRVWFDTPAGAVQAVDDVSLSVQRGEIVAVVGESGSGKSVTALAILKLIDQPPGRFESGTIRLVGHDTLMLSERSLVNIRGRAAAMLFQNPRGSLDPSFTISSTFSETLSRHRPELARQDYLKTIENALRRVGFNDWDRIAASYPHQLSGGMCQRVALAVTLECNPELLIADEPTTALDVGVQAKVLFHLRKLNRETGLPILLITHDFGVVRAIAHKVVVMYAGQVQEEGSVEEVLQEPLHPYTQALIRSVPDDVMRGETLYQIPGSPPCLIDPPQGCRFANRCEKMMEVCRKKPPAFLQVSTTRSVRCHLHAGTGGTS